MMPSRSHIAVDRSTSFGSSVDARILSESLAGDHKLY
jgi:hypothetical protein